MSQSCPNAVWMLSGWLMRDVCCLNCDNADHAKYFHCMFFYFLSRLESLYDKLFFCLTFFFPSLVHAFLLAGIGEESKKRRLARHSFELRRGTKTTAWSLIVLTEWCLEDVQLTEVHLYHSAIPFQPLSCVDHYIKPVKNLLTVFIFLLLCNLRLHQWICCGFIIRESFAHDSQLVRSIIMIFQKFSFHRIVWFAAVFGLSDHGFPPKHPATHFAFVVLGFWWSAWSGGNSSSQASSGS